MPTVCAYSNCVRTLLSVWFVQIAHRVIKICSDTFSLARQAPDRNNQCNKCLHHINRVFRTYETRPRIRQIFFTFKSNILN